uniref:Ephrin B3 n=1 Tax=Scophthalmus maximus TaxID=52904 RepID=A0A8D3C7N2_SCOMX
MGPHTLGVGAEMARRGNGLGILLVFLLDLLGTTASNMEPIYWNSLNERFRDDKGYILYPQIGDRLDLICPPLDTARSTPDYEFYKLYLVATREQADRCEVMGPPNIVLTCDEPTRERRFTIKFQEFSPNLWGHEFKSMHDYYIIDPGSRSSSGQPEVFHFLFWEQLGNKRGWETKKLHEQRAGETVRRYDKAAADPFLQASNPVADIMEDGCPQVRTDRHTHTHTHTHTGVLRQSPTIASSVTSHPVRLQQIWPHLSRHWKIDRIQTFKRGRELAGLPSDAPASVGARYVPRRSFKKGSASFLKRLFSPFLKKKKICAVEVTQGFTDTYSLSIDK